MRGRFKRGAVQARGGSSAGRCKRGMVHALCGAVQALRGALRGAALRGVALSGKHCAGRGGPAGEALRGAVQCSRAV